MLRHNKAKNHYCWGHQNQTIDSLQENIRAFQWYLKTHVQLQHKAKKTSFAHDLGQDLSQHPAEKLFWPKRRILEMHALQNCMLWYI